MDCGTSPNQGSRFDGPAAVVPDVDESEAYAEALVPFERPDDRRYAESLGCIADRDGVGVAGATPPLTGCGRVAQPRPPNVYAR